MLVVKTRTLTAVTVTLYDQSDISKFAKSEV
jgi:hypothetical protein